MILNSEAEKTLKTIVSVTPSILQPVWKKRILVQAEKNILYEGKKALSSKDILNAAKEVMPSGFSPLFVKLSNSARFKSLAKSNIKGSRESSKRWVKVNVKQSSAGKKIIKKKSEKPYMLAVCGSPRKNGNTDRLIKAFFEGARTKGAKCETIYLQNRKIGYCIGCRKCRENNDEAIIENFCTIKDDMTEIYRKLCSADAVVIGYPIYTARESAQMAVFWDRLDCMSNKYNKERFAGRKAGVLITCWAWPETETYRDQMEGIMMLMGLRGIETLYSISASGCRGKSHGRGVVVQDKKGMKKVVSAGVKTAEIITIK